MPALTKIRWELFAQHYFSGKSATESAKLAGYSQKTAYSIACNLLKKPDIKARINELVEESAAGKVMTIRERKERLSEIARARLADFVECGADGSWVSIGPESAHSAAIQEIVSNTEYDKNGSHPTVITRIKLHDPVKALAELNRMDGAYAPEKHEHTGADGGPIEYQDASASLLRKLETLANTAREQNAVLN